MIANKKRLLIGLILVLALVMSMFAGCSRDADKATATPTAEPSESPDVTKEPEETQEPVESKSPEPKDDPKTSEIKIPDLSIEAFDIPDTDSQAFVNNMKLGWNLGNTFDAHDCTWLSNKLDYEKGWSGIKTTEEMIQAVKDAGFNTVRIPVSWHNHVSGDDHTIDQAWLDRVQEVVDYAIDNGLYAIINIHHDMGEDFIYPSSQYMDQSSHYVRRIWTQLAERFKDYDEHLIFESLNEPRMVGSKYEWWLDSNDESCKDAVASINKLNQIFVDTVRASGANNKSRYLMVPGYAASVEGALNKGFELPKDRVEDRLILSIHAYTPYNFALEAGGVSSFDINKSSSVREIDQFMTQLHEKFVSQAVPVVIGEFGARNKKNNLQDRVDFSAYYVASARARGMTCIWWDNHAFTGDGELFGILDRSKSSWKYPEIVEAMLKYAD
nr:putative cellulase [uncultured bacterium]